jgi:hypothetical protein
MMNNNDELAAVITAVLNLYSRRPEIKLKIRSIKSTQEISPTWAAAGRAARMQRRLNT